MFVIEINGVAGNYAFGYSSQHICVQTTTLEHAKRFKTAKAAEKWVGKYLNAGYGVASFKVVEA